MKWVQLEVRVKGPSEPGSKGSNLVDSPRDWAEDFPPNGINRHGSIHRKEHPWLNVFPTSRNHW